MNASAVFECIKDGVKSIDFYVLGLMRSVFTGECKVILYIIVYICIVTFKSTNQLTKFLCEFNTYK